MRITQRDIESLANRINIVTGSPTETWGENGSNIGNYHISYAYGGASLHRIMNHGGGVDDIFRCGHIPKRELYYRMEAYIAGLSDAV
jgi:hypothetical protein